MIISKGREIKIEELINLVNTKITIKGRIKKKISVSQSLSFAIVKTHQGEIQITFDKTKCPPVNSIVEITGSLEQNLSIKKGLPGFEIKVETLNILNFIPEPKTIASDLKSRINHRGLDLRTNKVAEIFKLKSKALQIIRNILYDHDFIEVYTSKITGKSAEGKLNAFPVNYFGSQAYLSISNTLPHLEIMAGDIPKIFEIGPCFRGTRSKTKRHVAEFTVLDFCASYLKRDDMMLITEEIISSIVDCLAKFGNIDALALKTEIKNYGFKVISYQEAISRQELKDGELALKKTFYENLKSFCSSFTWITDFPIAEKSFYVKSRRIKDENLCLNFQLWHPKIGNLMDGAERITELEEAKFQIIQKGLDPANFIYYFQILEVGLPPCISAGLAIDRLLQLILNLKNIREVIMFPIDESILPK